MRTLRQALLGAGCVLFELAAFTAQAGPASEAAGDLLGDSPHAGTVRARLLSEVAEIGAGETFLVGVLIEMDSGWHTYWENGGDAGLPTTIEWTLPEGWSAGPILWPTPAPVRRGRGSRHVRVRGRDVAPHRDRAAPGRRGERRDRRGRRLAPVQGHLHSRRRRRGDPAPDRDDVEAGGAEGRRAVHGGARAGAGSRGDGRESRNPGLPGPRRHRSRGQRRGGRGVLRAGRVERRGLRVLPAPDLRPLVPRRLLPLGRGEPGPPDSRGGGRRGRARIGRDAARSREASAPPTRSRCFSPSTSRSPSPRKDRPGWRARRRSSRTSVRCFPRPTRRRNRPARSARPDSSATSCSRFSAA